MKKYLLIVLFLIAGLVQAQVSGKAYQDIVKHGHGGNSVSWVSEFVFVDSGATRIGPFSVDESPIGIAITRNAVWDSAGTGLNDLDSVSYHWDSTWTASDFAFLYGFETILNDSARAEFEDTDLYDFLPVVDEDGIRVTAQADSMQYTTLVPIKMAGAKYMYVEFYNSTTGALVAQTEPRTLVLFYRKY